MTREEALKILKETDRIGYNVIHANDEETTRYNIESQMALNMAIEALEKEPKMEQFAKWVASEIFDNNWEYNKDAFDELACRKLAKLGIVRAKGDEWELVEPYEQEE